MARKKNRLQPKDLCWHCDPALFKFKTTAELPPLAGTIGQDRALTAIDFGLGIGNHGFNLFVLGEPGTGRSSTVKKILRKRAADQPVPDDWCYVHGFEDSFRPAYIRLPAGTGKDLHKDIEGLVGRLTERIPKIFEGKDYEERKNRITEDHQEKNKNRFQGLEQEANSGGFILQRTTSGLVLVPTKDDHPLSQKDYEELSEKERQQLDRRGDRLRNRLNEVIEQVREEEKRMHAGISSLEQELLQAALDDLLADLEGEYADFPQIVAHLDNVKKDVSARIDEFRPSSEPKLVFPGFRVGGEEPSFDRYRVNLFLDNSALEGAPVVYEANPTYFNLFGRIEHIIQMGSATTNFSMIKPGALHRANGGYLILDCREVLVNLFSYEALKRCIRNREIKIEDMTEQYRLIATVSLKPEPIPLNCKVIIIGTPQLYYLLHRFDADFRKFFKVKVDFDRMMDNTPETVESYAQFISARCRDEDLVPFDPTGVARVIEHAARLVEDQKRFSSCFIDLSDLIRESSFYAARDGKKKVGHRHVEAAVEAKAFRSNKVEERIQSLIEEGTLLVDTEGKVAGQVNGLSVYQLGDYSFGRPSRVTARTYLGRNGLVNIEREAKLSGPIHDKGVLILTGFLGDRFAQDKPFSLAASICFEQSYAGVEGDSASSTELYALLSALSEIPIDQGIAVTGSVNQRGEIQPIGGVNEKIEGFYAVCSAKGLTGSQGVIVPRANIKNLMLKAEVVDAVRKGRFHVWGISNVDEGIEILTEIPAGRRRADGTWPEKSINALVDQKLTKMAETLRKFGAGRGNK